jgi:hypothetical protein
VVAAGKLPPRFRSGHRHQLRRIVRYAPPPQLNAGVSARASSQQHQELLSSPRLPV